MKAMILAAGKGERMLPLTERIPKPLLLAGEKPLIQYHIEALVKQGIDEIIINTGPMGELIEQTVGTGERFNASIQYSHEGNIPLGTGGGVQKALPLLGDQPFVLSNADIWTDFDYSLPKLAGNDLACLVVVDNPEHNSQGDFNLLNHRLVSEGEGGQRVTFSGIGLYSPEVFSVSAGKMFSFIPAIRGLAASSRVSGIKHTGDWRDIGTPERLQALRQMLK